MSYHIAVKKIIRSVAVLTLTQGHPKNFSKNFPQRAKR